MKLFVRNNNNQKIYLNLTAPTRTQLANKIGGEYFYLGNRRYNVRKVFAENDSNSTATGAVVGGTIGAFGGPLGLLIGGLVGGLIGNGTDESENNRVRRFNRS